MVGGRSGLPGLYERVTRAQVTARRGVEVVVVAYGRPDLLEASLQPVRSFPVTVVDNSSSPDVADVCERLGVRYLDPGHNGGFGAGVNHALDRRLDPDADVLLLNPDAVIARDDVAAPPRGVARRSHARLRRARPGRRSRPPEPGLLALSLARRAWLTAAGLGRLAASTGFVIGSVLMMRREALAQVGDGSTTLSSSTPRRPTGPTARIGWAGGTAR